MSQDREQSVVERFIRAMDRNKVKPFKENETSADDTFNDTDPSLYKKAKTQEGTFWQQ